MESMFPSLLQYSIPHFSLVCCFLHSFLPPLLRSSNPPFLPDLSLHWFISLLLRSFAYFVRHSFFPSLVLSFTLSFPHSFFLSLLLCSLLEPLTPVFQSCFLKFFLSFTPSFFHSFFLSILLSLSLSFLHSFRLLYFVLSVLFILFSSFFPRLLPLKTSVYLFLPVLFFLSPLFQLRGYVLHWAFPSLYHCVFSTTSSLFFSFSLLPYLSFFL